ncbi:WhiB family transcriptional regulator [Streptomyces sp. NPDC088794]|jgi:WhiB family redox-sensing transcriptional regulator|uniref:WhiB family transcriptional regulator n=1 Tax=Streptomyces sp. NPDC088794 TaxID=3365902 RepID=UPI0037FD7D7A
MDLTDDWRDQAACRYEDPDLFFPIGTSGPALLQTEQAKEVCGRCPVRARCLRWALDTGECLGVWGGTDETERRALQLRRRREEARLKRG